MQGRTTPNKETTDIVAAGAAMPPPPPPAACKHAACIKSYLVCNPRLCSFNEIFNVSYQHFLCSKCKGIFVGGERKFKND
jgi:hypothetical protein